MSIRAFRVQGALFLLFANSGLYVTSRDYSISGRADFICMNTLSSGQITRVNSASVVVVTVTRRKVAVS